MPSRYKILLVLTPILLLGFSCQKAAKNTNTTTNQSGVVNTNTSRTNTTQTEEALVLANLGGITFAPHTPGAATAGDIRMSKSYLDASNGFVVPMYVFGQPLAGKQAVQLNPNLEFGGLNSAITIVSAIDGVVGFVRQQTEGDAEVFLQPSDGSVWTVGYDHISDVTVKQGDRVTVGQVIGKAAEQRDGIYRYELQINKDVNGVTTFHCPTDLLNTSAKSSAVASIEQFIQDWNTFYGSDVYGSYTTSCTKSVLTLDETE